MLRMPVAYVAGLIFAAASARGGEARESAPNRPAASASTPLAVPIDTHHRGVFHGKHVRYVASVEPTTVSDAAGHPAARIVTVSYVVLGTKQPESRPVVFAFNGGPISASAVIHMGALGPKRVAIPDDITAEPSTFKLVDNPYALLDVADIVFFDPANTGYSRTLPGVDPSSYFSVVADGQQLAQLVLEWSKTHGRAASPKYLIGESYGTMRAVETANQLQGTAMPIAGVVLLGQAINIIEYAQRPGNIISYAVSLPTLAAIAWAHNRAERKGRSFDEFIRGAQAYGQGEYLTALFRGNTEPGREAQQVAARLQELTGISAAYYLNHGLKITKEQYRRELFPGQLLGLNDARYIGPAEKGDPFQAVPKAYEDAFKTYLREELHVGDIGEYLGSPVKNDLAGWDWGPNKTPFGDWPYAKLLSEVMQKNPKFRVLVGNGYYDTQTTIGAMDYLVSQVDWPTDRVAKAYYQGGHMFYSVEASLRKLSEDIRALLTASN
jgi:carboxypeptidase C (cathepsin A)